MHWRRRKSLSIALLAIYASISLLGHALHWLSPHDGHHHTEVAHRSNHEPHGHHHGGHHDHAACHADHEQCHEGGLAFAASGCPDHLHACDICAFLDQVKSHQPQFASAYIWHPLTAIVPVLPERLDFSAVCNLHAPRGPPILSA